MFFNFALVIGLLAISCVQRSSYDERIDIGPNGRSGQSLILIWSFHDPIHPQVLRKNIYSIASLLKSYRLLAYS